MKKYMVYLIGAAVLASVGHHALQAAAAPHRQERDIKEQAAAMADPEQYRDLARCVLREQHKVRQCQINSECAQQIAEAQEAVWDTLTEPDKNERALSIRVLETQFGKITGSIAALSTDVAGLKQRVAQENKGAWWRWYTARKKVNQNISVADIDTLTKQRDSLKRQYDRCDKARKKALSKIDDYNKLFAKKRAEKQSRPQQLVELRQLLQILANLTSKIGQMNKLMLEKDRLEWQLRLLAFERGRAALLEEERIQQLSRPAAAALEEQELFVGAGPEPVVREPEVGLQYAGVAADLAGGLEEKVVEEQRRQESPEEQELFVGAALEPVVRREPEVGSHYAGAAADPGGLEEKEHVSRREEKRRQESQRLWAESARQQAQRSQEERAQQAQSVQAVVRPIQAPEEQSKELEADRKQIVDSYASLLKQVSDLEAPVFELENQVALCRIAILCEQKKLEAQKFFFQAVYGQEHKQGVVEWKKENYDPVKDAINQLESEIVELKKNIAQENKNKGWGLLKRTRRGVEQYASVAGIGRLEKRRRKLPGKKEILEQEYQECSNQLAQIQVKIGQYQQAFEEQARVNSNQHERWVLREFTRVIADIDQMNALMLEKNKLERELDEVASRTTY